MWYSGYHHDTKTELPETFVQFYADSEGKQKKTIITYKTYIKLNTHFQADNM